MLLYDPNIFSLVSDAPDSGSGAEYGVISGTVKAPASSPVGLTPPPDNGIYLQRKVPPALQKGTDILDAAGKKIYQAFVPPKVQAHDAAKAAAKAKDPNAPDYGIFDGLVVWVKSVETPFAMGLLGILLIVGGIYLFGSQLKINVTGAATA